MSTDRYEFKNHNIDELIDTLKWIHQMNSTTIIKSSVFQNKEGIELVKEYKIWSIYYDKLLCVHFISHGINDCKNRKEIYNNSILIPTLKEAEEKIRILEEKD